MSVSNISSIFMMAVFLAVAACASSGSYTTSSAPHYKIGQPYKVNGHWYTPAANPNYDETGVASWYGRDFHGQHTANGEVFNMNGMTAAHKTLPLPSLVRVENLDNGRSVVVRVNDRGPFVGGRIIDLSREAARRLGYEEKGTARVRVRYLGPAPLPGAPPMPAMQVAAHSNPVPARPQPAIELAAIDTCVRSDAAPAIATPATSPTLASAAPPTPTMAPAANAEPVRPLYIIRVAALSRLDNIETLRAALAPIGPLRLARVERDDGSALYRVNMGPYPDQNAAADRLEAVREAGYADARIVKLAP